jgi:hypothetical protein
VNVFKIILIFIICLLFGLSGIFGYRYRQVRTIKPFIPTNSSFILSPPDRAMLANLEVSSGEITKYPRSSTESAKILDSTTLVQGDSIESDATSSAHITFKNNIQISVGPKANLQFIDTIPTELLLWQQDGLAEYTATSSSITVRSLSLLATISSSSASISVNDPNPGQITLTAGLYPIKVAYQDQDSNTHVIDIPASSSATYNHSKRVLKKNNSN